MTSEDKCQKASCMEEVGAQVWLWQVVRESIINSQLWQILLQL